MAEPSTSAELLPEVERTSQQHRRTRKRSADGVSILIDSCPERIMPTPKRPRATGTVFLDLPDDILVHICRFSIQAHMRCRTLSKSLLHRVMPLWHELKRLCWSAYELRPCKLTHHASERNRMQQFDFKRVRRYGLNLPSQDGQVWCAGNLLPTAGTTAWRVSVLRSAKGVGFMYLGICDSENTCAWSLLPRQGHLRRWSRTAVTQFAGANSKPAGYPNGHLNHILFTRDGQKYDLNGRAQGAVIDVIYDADAGTLSFRVDGGPVLPAVSGFPSGAAMRPWARVVDHGDLIRIEPCNV